MRTLIYCTVFYQLSYVTFATNEFRILGGKAALIETHPWDISIQNLNGFHVCGGAILNEETILTAAHCLINRDLVAKYQLVAGTTDFSGRSGAIVVRITKATSHPNFNPKNYDYDVAILKLEEPLTFNSRIKPIKLPNADYKLRNATLLVVSGWGVSKRGTKETTKILQETMIYSIDWVECNAKLRRANAFTSRMFCAGVPDSSKDTCQGDSGGPVEVNGIVVGVVSWGLACGTPHYPGAYANVATLLDWIKKTGGI